jgi:hypothetical protein
MFAHCSAAASCTASQETKLKERTSVIRADIAALLELERKTKAKMIVSLVHVKRRTFWTWQTRAYHADQHESMYGRLTEEETDRVCKMETVGELSALLTKVAEEGREKAKPIKKGRRLNIGCWLVGMLLLCIFADLVYGAVAWLVHRIFT